MKRLYIVFFVFRIVQCSEVLPIKWEAAETQSLEFSFPFTEQKKVYGAIMRVWSTLYWATVDREHRACFLQTQETFVKDVLNINSLLDMFLISCKKNARECTDCVSQMNQDIERFNDVVHKSYFLCCKQSVEGAGKEILDHACYILSLIKEKIDTCLLQGLDTYALL